MINQILGNSLHQQSQVSQTRLKPDSNPNLNQVFKSGFETPSNTRCTLHNFFSSHKIDSYHFARREVCTVVSLSTLRRLNLIYFIYKHMLQAKTCQYMKSTTKTMMRFGLAVLIGKTVSLCCAQSFQTVCLHEASAA